MLWATKFEYLIRFGIINRKKLSHINDANYFLLALDPTIISNKYLMFHIILFEPQIPPNTGNIIRLSANTGTELHLIEPLGFRLDEKSCRRAGLDYFAIANVHIHKSLDVCIESVGAIRLFAITSRGKHSLFDIQLEAGDAFLFGSETSGLPNNVHNQFTESKKLHLPMIAKNRSLNLANAASIVVYEAWRQTGFINAGKK